MQHLLIINILGVLAMGITTIISLPQLIMAARDHEGLDDVSIHSVMFLFLSDALYIAVDALLGLWIFVAGGTIAAILSGLLLINLLRHRYQCNKCEICSKRK